VSRFDAVARREYVVAFNTGSEPAAATFTTSTPSSAWTALQGTSTPTTDAAGRLTVTVPARASIVLKADAVLPQPAAPAVTVKVGKDYATGKYRLSAAVPGADPSTVTFVMRRRGAANWTTLGSDDARPFRVFIPPMRGTVEVAAVVKDTTGQVASTPPSSMRLVPFL
jgi:hypothetical protein